jgi:hypothetical protein
MFYLYQIPKLSFPSNGTGADAINISGHLNPKKLGNFKN